MSGRDYQRSKCYAWENVNVFPRDTVVVPFSRLQQLVDYIWKEEGLTYPPKVEPLPKAATSKIADANRLRIRAPEAGLTATILIHEIAHSMNWDMEVEEGWKSDHHGAKWMGTYMKLLQKYAGFDIEVLMFSAAQAKLKYTTKGN